MCPLNFILLEISFKMQVAPMPEHIRNWECTEALPAIPSLSTCPFTSLFPPPPVCCALVSLLSSEVLWICSIIEWIKVGISRRRGMRETVPFSFLLSEGCRSVNLFHVLGPRVSLSGPIFLSILQTSHLYQCPLEDVQGSLNHVKMSKVVWIL